MLHINSIVFLYRGNRVTQRMSSPFLGDTFTGRSILMRTHRLHLAALLGGIALLPAALAHADDQEYKEEVVHQTTTPVEVALNEQTVLCSHADYSALYLKVLIPKLASLTLLNHQNAGAGAPCVAAG